EVRYDGCSNSLTSVEKDNLVMDNRYKDKGRIYDGVSPTLNSHGDTKGAIFRRLTPRECFRLQGFLNDEINLDGLSDTQAYRLAGNGQSVNVVSKILKELLQGN
ncbi:MAG: DNA cytosine methyltransferase, partial [Candidatus Nanoarchaeia archaeon]